MRGHQRLKNVASNGALGYAFNEFLNDLEVNVGFKQGELDLAHARLNVGFGEFTFVLEKFEGVCQFV